MTAPARVAGPSGRTTTRTSTTRTRTQPPQRERGTGKPTTQPPDRTRSAAAERAYARRAQRNQRVTGTTRPQPKIERKPGSAGRVTFVVAVMALLIVGVVTTLWFSTQATADAYKLEQAKSATNSLQVRVGQLQQQVAQQDSPQSLAQRAQQLGMIPAPDAAHIVVGANGQVAVIGTPSVAEPPPPQVTAPPSTPPSTPPSASNSTAPSTNTVTTTATPPAGG